LYRCGYSYSDLIKKAKTEIILIDNYIDENTLVHLSKKSDQVKVLLLTKIQSKGLSQVSKQLTLDVKKANEQFGGIEVKELQVSHD
jgi:hypothetical protein